MATLSEGDVAFLRQGIQMASAAVARGDHPFGAVIVERSVSDPTEAKVVVAAMNSVNTAKDPTGHAETNAIRQLGQIPQREPSAPAVKYELFTSTEPCVMCCGAIYWSFKISRVVYACAEVGLAKYAGDDFLCPCRDTFARGKQQNIIVEGPFLEEEAEALHAAYWPHLTSGSS